MLITPSCLLARDLHGHHRHPMPTLAPAAAPQAPRAPSPLRGPAPAPATPVGRRIYITFGGEVYDGTTAMIAMLGPKFGADEVWVYDDRWLAEEAKDFRELNRWLWDHPHKRGFGWYVWKPYILMHALDRMKDGDVVLFTDADTCPIDDLSVLYETCAREGGIMLFRAGGDTANPYTQGQWCKRDCYVVMGQDEEKYRKAESGVARFMLFQKGPWRARQFLMEWLTYCVNPRATTFDPSVLGPEAPEFQEHRTEQAILSNLAHKYQVRLHREACDLGNAFPEDKALYPQLFAQLNAWGNKTAPCLGSRFRNVPGSPPAGDPRYLPVDATVGCNIAVYQAGKRRFEVAETVLRTVLSHFPDCFEALVLLGQIREAFRDFEGAARLYDRAIAVNPGHALPFTRRAIIRFRGKWGNPAAARPLDPNRRSVGMPSLGSSGRFGNQILQYGMLRLYAEKTGAQAVAPDWIGRDLFGSDDALPSGRPAAAVAEDRAVSVLAGREAAPAGDVEIGGFFCGDTSTWAAGRARFQSLFEPSARLRPACRAALDRISKAGRTLVGIHIRRGDFGNGQFWLAPCAWYLEWLESRWKGLDHPVLYLATDDPSVALDFSAFRPMSAADVGDPIEGAEFFLDHWILRHADLLAVSNSTFSVTAALLNRKNPECVRPDRLRSGLRPFDPWAEKVLLD
jgi:hypothetical protein